MVAYHYNYNSHYSLIWLPCQAPPKIKILDYFVDYVVGNEDIAFPNGLTATSVCIDKSCMLQESDGLASLVATSVACWVTSRHVCMGYIYLIVP